VAPGLLIGGGLAGVAVIGLLVGLAIAGGGEDDESSKTGGQSASSSPAGQQSSKAPDPAEGQAKKLNALLADSNNSRSAVVRSVARIRACKALGKAASDLRAAAKQRNGLVTRLSELETDQIPGSTQLNASLKSAWKSSAAADNHYAAWAGQVAGKKGCHKGTARQTSRSAAGNRASGTATGAKKKAATLWNPTATKYGLPARQFGEL
jgi:hypothetical protein